VGSSPKTPIIGGLAIVGSIEPGGFQPQLLPISPDLWAIGKGNMERRPETTRCE